ncbi:MAG: hypothetical protein ACR2P4_10020, partial [Gammaproteobacteria bacterium]
EFWFVGAVLELLQHGYVCRPQLPAKYLFVAGQEVFGQWHFAKLGNWRRVCGIIAAQIQRGGYTDETDTSLFRPHRFGGVHSFARLWRRRWRWL